MCEVNLSCTPPSRSSESCWSPGRGSGEALGVEGVGVRGFSTAGSPLLVPAQPSNLSPAEPTRVCRFLDFLLHLLPLPPVEADPSFPSSSHAPCNPRVPSSRKCTAQGRPPRAGAARRAPSPPGYCSGPAGTRLPIPYMDKCVQAKSGIQAPDVSLQRSGHRTGDRGEGGGEEGGGEHQPAAAPGLPKFHFLSVGSLPGPAPACPGNK